MIQQPKLLVFDIDGVLTDGRIGVSAAGTEEKQLSFRDLDAVKRMARAGLPIAFLTGEETELVDRIAARFNVTDVTKFAKDKLAGLKALVARHNLTLADVWYIGDSDRDAPAIAAAALGFAPADGTHAARAAAHRVLQARGGDGCAEEIESFWLSLDAPDTSQLQADMASIFRDSLAAHERLLAESLPVLAQVARILSTALQSGHKLMFFGNGGSAADAQHIAGEFVGRFLLESQPYAAIALTTDTSILTAVGNDWAFEDVFGRQIRALARPGDVAIGITTSGNSPNVLKGLADARAIGATTVGFTGGTGGQLPACSDVCFIAPAAITPRIQELHLLAWHTICEVVERELHHGTQR